MAKREKAPQGVIGVPQFAELSACVVKQLPRDIDPDIAQGWIKNHRALGKVLRDALCPVLHRVRASCYLDASFDGKESYRLTIRPLTKEQAFAEYRNSGGETWVWDEMEKNMPYTVPMAETLDVMFLNFGRSIGDDEALAEIDRLDVRPLIYEELIQYGIARPKHQEHKTLIGIGTNHTLGGFPRTPFLYVSGGRREMSASHWGLGWNDRCSFPVVLK